MADVKLPLSGDVIQSINPWTAFFSAFGSQFGVNINVGNSSNPEIEKAIIADVASYGKQLGRIEDAIVVLLNAYQPKRALLPAEAQAIEDLGAMLTEIAAVKRRHGVESRLRLEMPPEITASAAAEQLTPGTLALPLDLGH